MASSSSNPRRKSIHPRRGPRHDTRTLPPPLDNQINEIFGRGGVSFKTTILQESVLDTESFEGTEFLELLEFQSVTNLCENSHRISEDRVRWFYKYFKAGSIEQYNLPSNTHISVVMGDQTMLRYNHADFERDFGLKGYTTTVDRRSNAEIITTGMGIYDVHKRWPKVLVDYGMPDYKELIKHLNNVDPDDTSRGRNKVSVRKEYLTGTDRMLWQVIKDILLPTNNKDTKVTELPAVLLFCLKHRIKVDWPVLIIQHMRASIANKQSTTLPYGALISHIMGIWNVIDTGDLVSSSGTSITADMTLDRKALYRVGTKLMAEWEVSVAEGVERSLLEEAIAQRESEKAAKAQARASQSRGKKKKRTDTEQGSDEEAMDAAARLSVQEQMSLLVQRQEEMHAEHRSFVQASEERHLVLAQQGDRIERRQGRLMAFFAKFACTGSCTTDDVAELHNSPPSH